MEKLYNVGMISNGMKNHKNGGYSALIILLITVAIMALILWKSGFFGAVGDMEKGTSRTTPQEDLQALQKAKDLKTSLEQRYQ